MYSVKDMYYSTMYSFCRNIFPTDLLKHPVKSLCHDGNPLAFCCFGETAWVLVSQVTTHVAPQPQNYSHTSHFLLQESRERGREESGDRWKLCEQSWLWKIGVQSRGLFLGVQELLFESSKEIWGLGCFAASKNVVRGWGYLMSLSNWRGSNMWRLVLVNRKCFITHSYCQFTIR